MVVPECTPPEHGSPKRAATCAAAKLGTPVGPTVGGPSTCSRARRAQSAWPLPPTHQAVQRGRQGSQGEGKLRVVSHCYWGAVDDHPGGLQTPKRFEKILEQWYAIAEESRPALPALCVVQLAPSGAVKSWLPDHVVVDSGVQSALDALGKAMQAQQSTDHQNRLTALKGTPHTSACSVVMRRGSLKALCSPVMETAYTAKHRTPDQTDGTERHASDLCLQHKHAFFMPALLRHCILLS